MVAYRIEGKGNGRGNEDKREWINKQVTAGITTLNAQFGKLIITVLMCHHDFN